MDYALNERQRLLQDTARRVLRDAGGPRDLAAAAREAGYDRALWRQLAALGWLGLLAPDTDADTATDVDPGERPDAVDAAVLASEIGRVVLPGPFVETALLVPSVLTRRGGPEAAAALEAIATGEHLWSLAILGEAGWRGAPGDDLALRDGRLSGRRWFVPYARQARRLLVTARDAATGGLALVAAPVDASLRFTDLRAIDDRPQALVEFDGTAILDGVLHCTGETAEAAYRDLCNWGAVMAAAELAGMAEAVLEMTVAYAKQREQFGRAIGSFQAVQHQAADMNVDVQATKVMALTAAWQLTAPTPDPAVLHAAKGWAAAAARRVMERGHQLHGAIGFTLEHDMQCYYRRGKMLEPAFGGAVEHAVAIGRTLAAGEEASWT